MLLYNTTTKEQSLQVFGNWFTFKPGQMKSIDDKFGRFMIDEKRMHGLVELPEEFLDQAFAETEDGKRIKLEKMTEGRNNRINYLKGIVHNEEVSLKLDLEKANIKVNPNIYASNAYVGTLNELAEYKKSEDDVQRERMNEIQRLKKELNRE